MRKIRGSAINMIKQLILSLLGLIAGSLTVTYMFYSKGYYAPEFYDLHIYLIVNSLFCVVTYYVLSIISLIFRFKFTNSKFLLGLLYSAVLLILESAYSAIFRSSKICIVCVFVIIPIIAHLIIICVDIISLKHKK